MENINEKRMLNILRRAIDSGFVIDENKPLVEIVASAEDFLIDNFSCDKEEYCKLERGYSQSYTYTDKNGWTKEESGDITHYESKDVVEGVEGEKVVYYTTLINSEGEIIALYDYVLI